MPSQWALRSTGESLLPEERLRRRADFVRCYRQGRRRHGPLATLHVVESKDSPGGPRLGITVTRKVGGAVARHRLKRQIREIYRRWDQRRQLPSCDIVVHVKPSASRAEFGELQKEIQRQLHSLIRNRPQAG